MKAIKNNGNIVCTDVNYLHQKSATPIFGSPELKDTVDALLEAYNKLEGKVQGLSGVQVWHPLKVVLIRWKKGQEPDILIAPVVLDTWGSKSSMEGCESEPNKRYWVDRPRLAKVAYHTQDGAYHEKWLTYKKARIFCHEVDHLNGILLQDKGARVPDAFINRMSKN